MSNINSVKPTIYDLPGGSKVWVVKPYEKDSDGFLIYTAYVWNDCEYPGNGQVTLNVNRWEHITVVKEKITVSLNGNDLELGEGDSVQINEGDKYSIRGKGECLVTVRDGEGGESKIIDAG